MRIKKELKSYISTFDDKISDKEKEEIANILLEKYNTDKNFNKKVEKISKKLQSSTLTTSKKGGRRKTRKKQKGGLSDEAIAIIAGAIILTVGLVSVLTHFGNRYMNFRERGNALRADATISEQLQTPSSSDDERWDAQVKLQKLPRDASPTRQVRRCNLTGRPHGVYRRFGLSRNKLREAAMRGDVPGLVKSSW